MSTTPSSAQFTQEIEATTVGDQAPTPGVGSLEIFANQNGNFYKKTSGGVVTPLVPGVTSVGATAPVTSTGGATPNIGINPATTSAAGSQSAIDKAKQDNMYYDVTAWSSTPANNLVGDDSTDNATRWATLFSALPVGALVFFPAGTYRTSAEFAINADKHLRIMGAGMFTTTIKTITSTTAHIFNISGSYWYNSFENLRFDAATTKTAGAAININPGASGSAVGTNVYACSFINQFIGIDAQGSQAGNDSFWRNLDIASPAVNGRGIRINGDTINVTISQSTINCGYPPFLVAGTACIEVNQSGAVQMMGLEVIGGLNTLLLNANQGGSTSIAAIYATNCFFDQSGGSTVKITGANIVNRCKFVQCGITTGNTLATGAIAVEIASSGTGAAGGATAAADGIDFLDCDIYPNGVTGTVNGFQITGAQGVTIQGCRISGFTNGMTITPVASNGYTKFTLLNNKLGATNNFTTPNTVGLLINAGSFQYGTATIKGNDFSGSTTPITNNGTYATSNPLSISDNDGLAEQATPMVATPATIAAVETVIHQLVLPANSLLVGTTIKFYASGILTGTTPSILARLRIGALGTTGDTQVCATIAAVMTTATGWQIEGFLTIRSIGAGGACLGQVRTLGEGLATANRVSAQTATVAVDTTASRFLSLTLIGGGTTPVVTVVQAHAEIVRQ